MIGRQPIPKLLCLNIIFEDYPISDSILPPLCVANPAILAAPCDNIPVLALSFLALFYRLRYFELRLQIYLPHKSKGLSSTGKITAKPLQKCADVQRKQKPCVKKQRRKMAVKYRKPPKSCNLVSSYFSRGMQCKYRASSRIFRPSGKSNA